MLRRTWIAAMFSAGVVVPTTASAAQGHMEIGTEANSEGSVAGVFQFRIEGRNEVFEAPLRHCTRPITVEPGLVSVRWIARPGIQLVDIYTLPEGRLVDSDVAHGRATVVVPQGDISTQTVAIFRVEITSADSERTSD